MKQEETEGDNLSSIPTSQLSCTIDFSSIEGMKIELFYPCGDRTVLSKDTVGHANELL